MLIVANWKAYVEDLTKAKKLFATSKKLARTTRLKIILAPPAPFLSALALRNRSQVAFAAQDISVTTGGSHTGETTAQVYSAAGASYTLVGHSERRSRGETKEQIAEKLPHAIAHSLTPILCVGERERDSEGRYLHVIREELTTALEPLARKDRVNIIVAYEPLWAIGQSADHSIDSRDLAEMVLYIRKVVAEFLPGKTARGACVLYGGAVEPDNIRALAASSSVDGFLIGHASVDPQTFIKLVRELC